MTETIRLQVWRNAEDGAPVRYREGTVDITDEHIRAIVERAKSMGLMLSVVKESLKAQPADHCRDLGHGGPHTDGKCNSCAQENRTVFLSSELRSMGNTAAPVDDEATIDAVVAAYNKRANELEVAWCDMDCMQSLLAAIRRGEVTGLTTTDQEKIRRQPLPDGVERLRAELVAVKDKLYNLDVGTVTRLERERDAAIAAHAEAKELLQDAVNGNMWEVDIRKHLDKHQNKDASK